jgi:hypothetical protein
LLIDSDAMVEVIGNIHDNPELLAEERERRDAVRMGGGG